MDNYEKICTLCVRFYLFSIAIMLLATAFFIVPAIWRSIDRAAPADTITCGVKYERESSVFSLSFATNANNAKNHLPIEAENSHADK